MADKENTLASLAKSGRMRIAAALMVTALVGGGLGVIILRGDSAGNALLYSGLDIQEAAEMTDRLDTAGIKYQLEGGGSAIFVTRDKVDQARMMLSEQGLPTRGSVGWEIFDKTDALGQTSFVQNINKVRALEGELARTISYLDAVRAARVHLNLPEHTLFQRDAEKASATVVLGLAGRQMTPEKVRAIRNLVSTSVPGLSVNAITVVDDQGRMLAAGGEADEAGGLGGVVAEERKVAMEDAYRKKVLDVVENIAGIGAARVQVSLDVNFNRVTQSAETYDPDGRVVRSSTTREDNSRSNDTEPQQTVTAANNIPTGGETEGPKSTSSSEQSSSEETVNYEISKNVRTEITEGGQIQRLSVAVAVDDVRVPGADGAPGTFQTRSPEELDRILTLVKSAVGFDEARGDNVTVENISFARPDVSLDEGAAPGPFDMDKEDIFRGVEIGGLVITALLLVLFVLRPLAKGLFTRNDAEGPASLPAPKKGQAALPNDARAAPRAAGLPDSSPGLSLSDGTHIADNNPGNGIDVARISGQVKASSIKKMSEVVNAHPEESLAIIRSWLNESSSGEGVA